MQVQIRNLAAEEVGSLELADAVFGVEVRPDILHRVVLWQLAKRRAGTHKVKTRGRDRPHRRQALQAEGHRPRAARLAAGQHLPRRRRHLRPASRATTRIDLPKKVRALGLRCALSSKAAEGKLMVLDEATARRAQDQGAGRAPWASSARARRWSITGAEVERNFALRLAQPAADRRAAGAGAQRLRHPAPRHAGADPGRRAPDRGAPGMNKLRDVRRDPGAGGDREVDPGLGAQPGRLQGPQGRHQARDQGGGRGPVRRQGRRRSTRWSRRAR